MLLTHANRIDRKEHHVDSKVEELERHERVLSAAETVFRRRGFDQATIDEIADTASVAKVSVYWHFKGKERLFRKVYEALVEADVSAALEAPRPHAPAIEQIEAALDTLAQRMANLCTYGPLVLELWASAARSRFGLAKLLAAGHSRWHKLIRDILEEGRSRGEFNSSLDTGAAATLILATMNGVILDSRFGQGAAIDKLEKIKRGLLLAISAW
jgi:AcrR family transcriptional regulator